MCSLPNLASGRINSRFGPRPLLLAGPLICAAGLIGLPFAEAAVVAGANASWLAVAMLSIGIGCGLVIPTITSIALESVPRASAGIAGGILNTSRQIGGVAGVAVFGAATASLAGYQGAFRIVAITGGAGMLCGWTLAMRFVRGRDVHAAEESPADELVLID